MADVAQWVAWDLNLIKDTEGDEATSADIVRAEAAADLYAAELVMNHSASNEKGLAEATAIATADAFAAAVARDHMFLVYEQALAAFLQEGSMGSDPNEPLQIDGNRLNLATGESSVYVGVQGDLELDVTGSAFAGAEEIYLVWTDGIANTLKLVGSNGLKTTVDMGAGDDTIIVTETWTEGAGSLFDGGVGYDALVYDHDGLDGDDYVGPATVNLHTPHASDVGAFQSIERFEGSSNGTDTFIGTNSTWHITGLNSGDIDGVGVIDFTLFENLTGGPGDDDFIFSLTGSITGNLDGGLGFDMLDYRAFGSQIVVNRAARTAPQIGGTFTRVEKVWSGTNPSDFLIGENVDAEWRITGDDSGEMAGATVFEFQSMENLTGGTAGDAFVFSDGKIITGVVRGEGGTDAVDMDYYTTHNVAWIADDTGGFSGALQTNEARTRDIDFAGIEDLSGGMTAIMWHFADLMPEFYTFNMPDLLVPNDMGSARIIFTNRGNVRAVGDMVIELYLSLDRELDAADYLVGRTDPSSINLAAGHYMSRNVPIAVPPNIPAGDYHYIFHLDVRDDIEEISNRNNVEASKTPERVLWRFGKVGEREDVPLRVHDENGTLHHHQRVLHD